MPKPMRQMSSREREHMEAILDRLIAQDPRMATPTAPKTYSNNVIPVSRAKELGLAEEIFDFFEIVETAKSA